MPIPLLALCVAVCALANCWRAASTPLTVEMSVVACVQLAEHYRRPDIAKACEAGGDIAAILDSILGENATLRASLGQRPADAGADGAPRGR